MTDNKPAKVQKGRYQLNYRGTECLNCGLPLDMSDKYCPSCSQANSTKKLTLKDFFDEFFSSLISYDSKLLKTLSALLLRPGKITKDYINGKRVAYTNPFRFLLSLAIVYFLMLNFAGDLSQLDRYGAGKDKSPLNFDGDFSFMDKINIDDDEAKKGLQALDSLNLISTLEQSVKKKDSLMIADPKAYYTNLKGQSLLDGFFDKREFFGVLIEEKKLYDFNEIPAEYAIEKSRENEYAFNAARSFIRFKQQPGSFAHDLISKLPFFIFFFLPVFALFIFLIYIRKKYTYTDHLIFSFHNQSLLFILLIISYLIDSVFDIFSSWFFMLVFSIYLYKSMRKFYEQGRFKTIVKYIFLNTIFFILALFSSLLLVMGSLFTY